MILAAGLGSRLKPFTDEHPKALAIVNKKTLLQRNIEYLSYFGVTDIIINVHHFAQQIKDFIKEHDGFGSHITISDESDEVLETGGGLLRAAWFFDENTGPFVLMNADILTDMDLSAMIYQHKKLQPVATLAVTSRLTTRYFLFDEMSDLCGWKNSKTGEQKISRQATHFFPKAFSGIHVISPKIFSLIKFKGKFSMVDVYLNIAVTHAIKAFDHSNSKFIDVGKPENIVKAEGLFV